MFKVSYLGTHHSHLSRWPGIVQVASHMLRVHDTVSSTISLTRYYGNLGHCGFSIGENQLGSMTDDTVVLLVCSWDSQTKNTQQVIQVAQGHFSHLKKSISSAQIVKWLVCWTVNPVIGIQVPRWQKDGFGFPSLALLVNLARNKRIEHTVHAPQWEDLAQMGSLETQENEEN